MNSYFVSIGKLLSKVFSRESPVSRIVSSISSQFHLHIVSTSFVSDFLSKLKTNKAIGLDKLSARLLKDASAAVSPVIIELINKSFVDGVFPKVWKSARVPALLKGGNRFQKDNYRPISILPTVSKIVEKAAHVQLCIHLEQNKLLSHSQYGFRQRRSTSTALINFTDQMLEDMDNGQIYDNWKQPEIAKLWRN